MYVEHCLVVNNMLKKAQASYYSYSYYLGECIKSEGPEFSAQSTNY